MNKDDLRIRLHEALTKDDIKSEVLKLMDSKDVKDKLMKIFNDSIKNNKPLGDEIVNITSNVLTQLYKQFYTKRAFWKGGLSNKAA